MSRWNYVASAHKATVVDSSVVSRFVVPDQTHLIVAKSNRLELFHVTDEGLIPLKVISVHGIILKIEKLQAEPTENLLLVTDPYAASIVSYDGSALAFHASLDLSQRNKIKTDYPPMIAVDQFERAFCTHFYKGISKLVVLTDSFSDPIQFSIDEDTVLDIQFLNDPARLQLLILFSDGSECKVRMYDCDPQARTVTCLEHTHLPPSPAYKLMPLPQSAVGVITHEGAVVYQEERALAVAYQFSAVTAVSALAPDQWLVGNQHGELSLVLIADSIQVLLLGQASVACTLTPLGSGLIFLGSFSGDSLLLSFALTPNSLAVLQSFTNIGPTLDLAVTYSGMGPIASMVSCSGHEQDGSIRSISKGTQVDLEAAVEVGKIAGIWPIGQDERYTHLVLSNASQTAVMFLEGNVLAPLKLPELTSDPTIFMMRTPSSIVQVTSKAVKLLDFAFGVKFTVTPADGTELGHARSDGTTLVVAVSGVMLVTYTIGESEISETAHLPITDEVACVTVEKGLVAVGFWGDMSVVLFTLQLEEVRRDKLREDILPRSVLFETLEDVDYLFVGLADGHLIIYDLVSFNRLSMVVGSKQVELSHFPFKGRRYVFAACDRPKIIYSEYRTIHFAMLNTGEVEMMAPFTTEDYPECIALVSGAEMRIVNTEEIISIASSSIPIGNSVHNIVSLSDMYVFTSKLSDRQSQLIVKDSTTLQTNEVYQMEPGHLINCLAVKDTVLIIGIGEYVEDEVDPIAGWLKAYQLNNGSLTLFHATKIEAEVTALAMVSSSHVVLGLTDTLVYAELQGGLLNSLTTDKGMSYILCIDIHEQYVVVADMFKLIKVYETADDGLTLVTSSYSAHWPTAIKLISAETLLVADAFGHILLYEINEEHGVQPIGGYYMGELVNCFRQGSLVGQMHDGLLKDLNCYLFATTKGTLGVIASLSQDVYMTLSALQDILGGILPQTSTLNLWKFREPNIRGCAVNWTGFLDGDFIEEFLKLQPNQQVAATEQVNAIRHSSLSVQDLQKLVLTLSTVH